jgi:hypothetical protein
LKIVNHSEIDVERLKHEVRDVGAGESTWSGWSLIFFGLHQPGWAVVEIEILWLAIARTVRAFSGVPSSPVGCSFRS